MVALTQARESVAGIALLAFTDPKLFASERSLLVEMTLPLALVIVAIAGVGMPSAVATSDRKAMARQYVNFFENMRVALLCILWP